jgi:protein SCO1
MPNRNPSRIIRAAAAIIALGVACIMPCSADIPLLADELPKELDGVGIVEHLNSKVPFDVAFRDESDKEVRFGDYFAPGKPVLLTINYIDCPMLCSLTLNGLIDGLNGVELAAGRDFTIVTVSMDPLETPEQAAPKVEALLNQYRKEASSDGWHLLTGRKSEIDTLCKAVGFGYRFDEKSGEYAHTASIMFITPDGRISRYMNNVQFEPRDLKLALVEASQGTIGSAMDRLLLFMCYHYDPIAGGYTVQAKKIMRLGGLVTVIVVGAGLLMLWRGGTRAARAAEAAAPAPDAVGALDGETTETVR